MEVYIRACSCPTTSQKAPHPSRGATVVRRFPSLAHASAIYHTCEMWLYSLKKETSTFVLACDALCGHPLEGRGVPLRRYVSSLGHATLKYIVSSFVVKIETCRTRSVAILVSFTPSEGGTGRRLS